MSVAAISGPLVRSPANSTFGRLAALAFAALAVFLLLPFVGLLARVSPPVLLARLGEPAVLSALRLSFITSAWRVASTLFWLLLLGLGAITALLIVFAPLVIAPFGDPGGDKQLAITLSRILFPIVVLLGISGIIVGILNSYEHFTVPALTPVFWNLAIIVGLVLGVPRANTLDTKLYVYAISIVIGTVIQVLLPLPWLYGLDDRGRWALLLEKLRAVEPSRRTARFRCVIALVGPGRPEQVVEGVAEGVIVAAPRGRGGFGYDPVFFYPPLGRTFAELSDQEKAAVSHRGRALASLRRLLGG